MNNLIETRERVEGHVRQSKDDWWDCLYCPDKQHRGYPPKCPDKIIKNLKPVWKRIKNE